MLSTLFVIDNEPALADSGIHTIHFNDYLREYPKLQEPKVWVINLCESSQYLSQGYYCSLLAEARNHKVLPSVKVINALRSSDVTLVAAPQLLPKEPQNEAPPEGALIVCMGHVSDKRYQKLANWVYQQYAAPILQVTLQPNEHGMQVVVSLGSLVALSAEQKAFCLGTLEEHSHKSWRTKSEKKKYRWELAILTNPQESVPPSNKGAISRFINAAEKLGIWAKEITQNDLQALGQFDALFIRETTAIDHHTYRFANEAEKAGLVVIDDPTSILRCCNKVYLHDAFSYKKVPSAKTLIVAQADSDTLDTLERDLGYPLVLKMPESAFSKGVFKVKNREELEPLAKSLLSESALLIAQEYLFTEYDWRIGVLNGRALYACRYYMAKNHWQIYNHSSKRNFSGGYDALPTFEVPTHVLQAALKASTAVGNGLYGVDVKEKAGKAYVLEVNDNPNIDFGVEDKYLGEELYMQVMAEFLRRLEARGRA